MYIYIYIYISIHKLHLNNSPSSSQRCVFSNCAPPSPIAAAA